jgi:hypothetical protein
MTAVTLNITLDGDDWDPSLLQYVEEEFEVCVHPPYPNATLPVNLTNLTMCVANAATLLPAFPLATNESNATCAYVGNGTNVSLPSTWAWGYPWRLQTFIHGITGAPLFKPSWASLAIGGADWRAARAEGLEATDRVEATHRELEPMGVGVEDLERLFGLVSVTIDTATTMVSMAGLEALRQMEAEPSSLAWAERQRRLSPPASPPPPPPPPPPPLANAGSNATIGECQMFIRRVYSESTTKLLAGIVSARLEEHGWMRAVQPRLNGDLLRRNGSTVTLTLPPMPQYDLDAPEILSVKIPREALRSGTPWKIVHPAVTARGRNIWIRSIGLVERVGGRSVRIFGLFQDVTAEQHAKAELERGRVLLEEISALSGVGGWEYDSASQKISGQRRRGAFMTSMMRSNLLPSPCEPCSRRAPSKSRRRLSCARRRQASRPHASMTP